MLMNLNPDTHIYNSIDTACTPCYHTVDSCTMLVINRIMDGFTDDKVVTEARYAWKYGCSRGVSGTPFFMINGVLDPNGGSYTVDDWTKLINELMMGP